MAYFTAPLNSIGEQLLFVRETQGGRQVMVYQAVIDTAEPCAMILPLSTPTKTQAEDVRIQSLNNYASFFVYLGMGFPSGPVAPRPPFSQGKAPPPTADIELGEAEASFVATAEELRELPGQLRPAEGFWKLLTEPEHHGFAVLRIPKGIHRLIPVAIDFPRRNPRNVAFPIRQQQGAQFTERTDADVVLYAQPDNRMRAAWMEWSESQRPLGSYMRIKNLPAGLCDLEAHVLRRQITGARPNVDLVIGD